MKKNLLLKLFILTMFPMLLSGIIRHDVAKEKYIELANRAEFESVGEIWINTYFSGSGVLISDQYVLTAAHNIIESDTRIDTITNNGKIFYANVPVNHRVVESDQLLVNLGTNKFSVAEVIVHHKYLSDIDRGEYDVALLRLEESVEDLSPAIMSFSPDELNSEVTGVGFGASGVADKEKLTMEMEKLAGQNVVDSIGGLLENGLGIYLYSDFDSPDNPATNKLGSHKPRDLEYLSAAGDSGGGLFREIDDNEVELIAINKGTEFDHRQFQETIHYGQIMRWTRLAPFQDWITKSICKSTSE